MTTLYLQVEVERVEGKFVGKDELGDALIEGLDTDLYVDESNYEVTDTEVVEWPDPMLSKSERALVCKALEGGKLTAKQQEKAKALVARLSDAPKVTTPVTAPVREGTSVGVDGVEVPTCTACGIHVIPGASGKRGPGWAHLSFVGDDPGLATKWFCKDTAACVARCSEQRVGAS